MSSFKSLAFVVLSLATSTIHAQEPAENIFEDMTFAQTVMALGLEQYLTNARGEITPRFEEIVGYTDTGVPITQRRRGVARMGIRLAKLMLEREEQLVREGKMKPRKRPLTWEQREAIIAERIAKTGPITTETFIIPGTTPEQSKKIHSDEVGMIIKTDHQGQTMARYVDEEGNDVTSTQDTKPLNPNGHQESQFKAVSIQTNERHFQLENNDENESIAPQNSEPVSAEELYRQYFPDEYRSSDKKDKVSFYESVLSYFVSPAYAEQKQVDKRFFSHEEMKAFKADKDQIEKNARSKKTEGFIKDVQTVTPEMMDKAKALSEVIRTKPIDLYSAVESLDPNVAQSLTEKNGKLVFKNESNVDASKELEKITLIFISYSLSERQLLNIFHRNLGRHDVQFVMRGVPEGQDIAKGAKKLQKLAQSLEPQPNIVIDPTLFTYFDVKAVPTVVRATVRKEQSEVDRKNGHLSLIAKVEGLHNDEWIKQRIQSGEQGNLGQQGEIFEIAEPDMIEEMKRRVAQIDWDAKKREAIKRFWKNQTFLTLKQANRARVREIDPSLVVTEDIHDANGLLIHKAGTVVNPLSMQEFNSMLVIFDPTDKNERDIIDELKKKWSKEPYKNRIFIASSMDKQRGWEAYEELTNWLDEPLYMLMPDVKTRFQIEATPSLVTADNQRDVFVIEEIPVPVKEAKEASDGQQK